MTSPHHFKPDLANAVLEDRTLMAYSPFVPPLMLTTGGYIALMTPPGLSANLNMMGGAGSAGAIGGGGGNMGTSFYITGFGTSTLAVGNATGFAGVGLSGGGGGAGGSISLTTTVGSGAAENGGAGGGVTRNTLAQGPLSPAVLNTLYIGQTNGSPDGGYSGGRSQNAPAPANSAPVPPAPPPG
jgi:hypothetical protein